MVWKIISNIFSVMEQWQRYQDERHPISASLRKYNINDYVCFVCNIKTYRKRIRALRVMVSVWRYQFYICLSWLLCTTFYSGSGKELFLMLSKSKFVLIVTSRFRKLAGYGKFWSVSKIGIVQPKLWFFIKIINLNHNIASKSISIFQASYVKT